MVLATWASPALAGGCRGAELRLKAEATTPRCRTIRLRASKPWPPAVQPMPPESPPLGPDAAWQSFYMPPGHRIELVASEPLIQDPVALDWDVDGRLWAVEMPGFMADLTGSNEHEPIGRVVVLEDADRDGRMDKRTVFADRLVLARSIKVLDRGVLVAEPPNLWLMKDTTGDLKMDSKELVTSQFGRFEGDPQNNANGFVWALDNRLYTAGQADVQLRLKNGAFEVARTLRAVNGHHSGRRRTDYRTPTSPQSTSTWSRPPTTPGTRTWCGPAEATNASPPATKTSTSSGRCGRIPGRIAPIKPASIAPTGRSPSSPRSAGRSSIAAIACRRKCTETCSSPSLPPTWCRA